MTYKGREVRGGLKPKIPNAKPTPLDQTDVYFLSKLIRLHGFLSRIPEPRPCPCASYATHPRPGSGYRFV